MEEIIFENPEASNISAEDLVRMCDVEESETTLFASSNEEKKEIIADLSEIRKMIFEGGSTWIKKSALCKKFGNSINVYLTSGDLVCEKKGNIEYVSDKSTQQREKDIAEMLVTQSTKIQPTFAFEKIEKAIAEVESEIGISLAVEQKNAIATSVRMGFSYIAGIPGSGKTTVTNALVSVMKKLKIIKYTYEILFLAPTGKASKRMSECVKRPAYTIDSKILPKGKFKEKIIIVDESSMMDSNMLYFLLKKAVDCRKVIFLGDRFQLTSVGEGSVLKDICSSDLFGTYLEKCFRQSADSVNLKKAISEIMKGTYNFTEGNDFKPVSNFKGDVMEDMVNAYLSEVEENGVENVCMLVPFKKAGKCNSITLNEMIKNRLFNSSDKYLIGERVIQTVNREYAVNGDIGYVTSVTDDIITVKYEDKIVEYSIKRADEEIEMAYAMSIHKSQGSEYKVVIMCTLKEHTKTTTKNLIYTGITRAKKKAIYYYEDSVIKACGKKEASELRCTMLSHFINDLLSKKGYRRTQLNDYANNAVRELRGEAKVYKAT